jgi:sarcosine oxidase subunit delta
MDVSDNLEDWHEAIHMRNHSTGLHPEFWYHDAGCQCWIEVERDVTTHSIAVSRPAKEAVSTQVK